MPSETTTGANTYGCLVNGNLWLPKISHVSVDYLNTSFYVKASYSSSDPNDSGQNIVITGTSLTGIGKYNLRKLSPDISGVSYQKNSSFYWFKDDSGYFEITRLDSINVIMSGRFAFNGVNSSGDTVKITQGRFDIKYKN